MYRLARSSRILLLVAVLPACGGGEFTSKTRSGSNTAPDAALDGSGSGGDGSASGSGSATGSGGASNSSGGANSGGGQNDGGASAGGDPGTGGTVATGGADAGSLGNGGTPAGGDSGSAAGGTPSSGGNGSGGVDGSGGSCPDPTTWYVDLDQDGYGSDAAQTVVSCTQPQGHYVKIGGDCHDNNGSVHPQLTATEKKFFGKPYRAQNGTDSYDYDCSGKETGDPSQPIASTCALLTIGGGNTCGGTGYSPSTSGGTTSSNRYCGSQKFQACTKSGLTCATTSTDISTPYACN
jgi:hypothetical protein